MWNIEYKGTLKGSIDSIVSGKEIPDGATQFKEPETTWGAFAIGSLIELPVILLMVAIAFYRMRTIYAGITKQVIRSEMKISIVIICLALIVIATYVHEYIHAFLFPKVAKKQIYVAPSMGALFVYSEDMISKIRFIIMALGPAFVLGILPYVIWFILVQFVYLPITVSVAIVLFCICMFFSAVGDITNVYNCIRQVPAGAKVFNHGFHTYWINS